MLTLDEVAVTELPAGAFRGLVQLQSLTLRNVASLRAVGQDLFDALLSSSKEENATFPLSRGLLRCLNVNISGPNFGCSCKGNAAWLPGSLARAAAVATATVNGDLAAWVDRFADGPVVVGGCDVAAVACSGDDSTDASLRGVDLMRVNFMAACAPPPPPSPRPEQVVMPVTRSGEMAPMMLLAPDAGSGNVSIPTPRNGATVVREGAATLVVFVLALTWREIF